MTRSDWRNLRTGLLFISPWIIGFSAFLAYPIAMSLYYSLCDFSVLRPPVFVGLANYQELLSDDVFRAALLNTAVYAAAAIPLGTILALALAMLLNTGVRGMGFFRTVFYLPSMVPSVALAILWTWIFNSQYGILNLALREVARSLGWFALGFVAVVLLIRAFVGRAGEPIARKAPWALAALAGFVVLATTWLAGETASLGGIAIDPPNWLNSAFWVKPAFVLMSLWGAGNAMVIYLAGLQDVPVHLYEAADLDGANWWRKVTAVTLPMLSPVILFNSILSIIGTFNFFAVPFIMAPGGQPGRSAYFLAVNLYDNAFMYLRMGYASATAWILFLIVFSLTMLAMKLSERHVHYGGG
ncbi:MAG: carbohydrate ABC transporter permease [Actinomycetota bacterium]